jgi:ribonuclease HI
MDRFVALSFALGKEPLSIQLYAHKVAFVAGAFRIGERFVGESSTDAGVSDAFRSFMHFVDGAPLVVLDRSPHKVLQVLASTLGVPVFGKRTQKVMVWAWIQQNIKGVKKIGQFAHENGIRGLDINAVGFEQAEFIARLMIAGLIRAESEAHIGIKSMPAPESIIYTDGSYLAGEGVARGIGAWAFITLAGGQIKSMMASACLTNDSLTMELMAIQQSLARVEDNNILVRTDAMNAVARIVQARQGNVSDDCFAETVKRIIDLTNGRNVEFEHVRAHSGVPVNEMVDALAKATAKAFRDNGQHWE